MIIKSNLRTGMYIATMPPGRVVSLILRATRQHEDIEDEDTWLQAVWQQFHH